MALIEMNMAYHFPIIYWNCACLTINASANEDVEDNKSTNYGKIAKAIGDMQHHGVKIALPDINTAKFGFSPDQKNNQIVFGLKGINAVGDDVVQQVIANRPYDSLNDFVQKNKDLDTRSVINLIKAGCFDSLEPDRNGAMRQYIVALTKAKVPAKETPLSLANLDKAKRLGIVPDKFKFELMLINFKKYVFTDHFKMGKNVYLLDNTARIFFDNYLRAHFKENVEYQFSPDGIVLVKSKFEKWFKSTIESFKEWLVSDEALKAFNKASYEEFAYDIWDKYCFGNISEWEMDSLSFYYHPHELSYVDKKKYDLTDYQDIPPEPIVIGIEKRKSKNSDKEIAWEKYKLFKIVGTVLDKNANKNYITFLTTTGVVTVKFYSGQFTNYDKQISKKDSSGKKTVIEKSWFLRGNKLLITGIRRGDTFYPKKYYDSIYQHTVCLIEEVGDNGSLKLKYEREKV